MAYLLQALERRPARRYVLGLVGQPGAGKSTLARRWTEQVNASAGAGSMVALGMDGFHLPRDALAAMQDPQAALARRGAPWTFDPKSLSRALQALRVDSRHADETELRWPGFEHAIGDPVPDAVPVPSSARLVLVEGLYLLHRDDGWDVGDLLDECWYLEVATEVALERLVQRHIASWGLSRDQAMERIATNDRLNAEIVAQHRARADRLVRS